MATFLLDFYLSDSDEVPPENLCSCKFIKLGRRLVSKETAYDNAAIAVAVIYFAAQKLFGPDGFHRV
jgi:hypothetical protein